MHRRDVLLTLAAAAGMAALPQSAFADSAESDFYKALEDIASNPEAIAKASAERERYAQLPGDPLGAQSSSWNRKSGAAISELAKTLIITFEVSGEAAYKRLYETPIWPKGGSGVTIGIGYDLGFASEQKLTADWGHLIDEGAIKTLSSACGITGSDAGDLIEGLKDVTVEWESALAQFNAFLPFAIGKTEDTFPNTSELPAHSLGALVSLVYNRGPSLSPSPRRKEMREVYKLMSDREFNEVPGKIRDMKRLWKDQPDLAGLVTRRDKEAELFELGLNL